MESQTAKQILIKSSFLIVIGILFLAFVIRGFVKRKESLDALYSHTFKGKITRIKDVHKGGVVIWLNNPDTSFWIPGFAKYLPALKIGDSLFKKEKSYLIFYYKRNEDSSVYLFDRFKVYSEVF